MEKSEVVIIGAGVIGLAIAERLSGYKKEIIVVERHESFGKETSSRNSEVIHAGIYYPADSLQAQLCVEGNRRIYELCEKERIPYKKIGKLIISNTPQETDKLRQLFKLAQANGVPNIAEISKAKVAEMEPFIKADEALFSPETGILDTHLLMRYFESKAEAKGVTFAYNCSVTGLRKNGNGFIVAVKDTDGEALEIAAEIVINCAGLGSGDVAHMAGIDIKKTGYEIYPCKGEYFKLSNKHKGKLNYLVYPAPTKISLGIHTVLDLRDGLKLGPNAYYINDPQNYDIDNTYRKEFYKSAQTYLPFIEEDDLTPDMAGIRPKIQPPNDSSFKDFIIRDEADKGLKGLINLIGIESPGLTSCLTIAEYVEQIINKL